MRIEKNSVVSIEYELSDAAGNIIENSDSPISYLHGGYGGIFPMVEEALHDKEIGYSCAVLMEPENTFGDHDGELIRVEPRELFPENIVVGMQLEGGEENSEEKLIYTVTEVAEETVVVDGNHPLAGITLNFECTVTEIRPATEEEISHQHVHGAHGHEH